GSRAAPTGRTGRSSAAPSAVPASGTGAEQRSFTERYHNTPFETPEGRAMAGRSGTRFVRVGAALILVVAVLAVAGYGAVQLLAPGGTSATPTGSAVAQASSSPGASPALTPAPPVTFTPAQTAQVAFCLVVPESTGLDADLAAAQAAVKAADHGSVAADATALVARVAEMRLAAQEMTAMAVLAPYAAAYDAGLKGIAAAASSLATAGAAGNAKAEAKASTALNTAQAKLHASAGQRATLVSANPVLACTAA
ncbi:MAG: hypothetical protein ACHQZR_03585, partial [Candidatus Limnocylindrales bacterium]